MFAIAPAEVASVAEAIALESPVFCVAKTATGAGPQDTQPEPLTKGQLESDPSPLSDVVITETLIDGIRSLRAFRRTP